MRNEILTIVVVLSFVVSIAEAQKIGSDNLPADVKNAFEKAHPQIRKVKWKSEEANYEASYTVKGVEASEVYSKNGMLIESEVEIDVASLPPGIISYINTRFRGTRIGEAAMITKSNGEKTYEAEIKGNDLVFDGKGNLLTK